jgi:dTDP-4-dehydrorhamnose reductase
MSSTPFSPSDTKVIVLTGASGYLGQHCLRELIEYDCYQDEADVVATATAVNDADKTIATLRASTSTTNAPFSSRTKQRKIIIYALVHQSSSPTELSDAITSYYKTCDDHIKEYYTEHVTVITVALDITSPTACDEWFESLKASSSSSSSSSSVEHTSHDDTTTTTTVGGRIIDGCIHTAALSSPALCEQQPEYAMSINVPTYFLQHLFRNNPSITIIALSTDQVYDGNVPWNDKGSIADANDGRNNINTTKNHYYNEYSKCDPCNVYGTTKVALESYLLQQQQNNYPQSSVLLLRSSILLGPKVPFLPHKAHSTFLHFCHSRIHEATTYFTNEIRSVIAVSDVVQIIVRMIHHFTTETATPGRKNGRGGIREVYCMGGPTPVNRYDMAKAVLSYFHVADAMNEIAVPVLKESPNTISATNSGSVKSPLNISMDSTKLLHFMNDTASSSADSHNLKFLTLSDIVQQTFSEIKTNNNII